MKIATKLSYKQSAKIARAERIALKRDVKQAMRGFSDVVRTDSKRMLRELLG